MSAWFAEVWLVFCHSTKTQVAVVLGLVFFVGIMMIGQSLVGDLELHGALAPLTDVLLDRLLQRYDKAAWMALAGFLLSAIMAYWKDRRRLLGI